VCVIGDGIFTRGNPDLCWQSVFCAGIMVVDFFASLTFHPMTFIQTWPVFPGDIPDVQNMNFLCQGFRNLSSDRQTESIDWNYNPHCFMGGQQDGLSVEVIPPTDRKHRHVFYASATSSRWQEALCFVVVCLVVRLLSISSLSVVCKHLNFHMMW